ncbi:MAG: GAF domain-containing protein, partial [Chitinophagaceae bacterium]
MKEFLRRLSLPAKLVLIGVLPMLFLLVVAFEFNKEKDDKLQMVDNYRTRIRQATYINELISRLQAERRYSFSYNLSGAWENRMLQQRSQTDDLINTIEKEASKELSGFQSYTFLSQLQTFRDRLDKHEVAPLEVMNYYTNAIFRLNTLNGVSSGNNIYLKDVIKPVTGQKLLSDIITYKGMILAQIYYMLETKKADAQLLGSVIQLQDIINSYLKEFALKAPPEMERQLEALKNDFDVKEATRIETAIRETSLLDTTIASDYWWNVATKAVDKHKGLQQQMMEQSRVGADEIYAKEKKAQIVAVIILLAVIILVLSLIFLVIRIITEALAELRNAAGLIAEGKTGVKLKPESNDAIGSLTESILKIDRNNNQLATAARAIGEGRFDVAVQPRSSEDVLGNAVVQMKQDLSSFRKSNEEKLWTQTGVALVNDSLRGDKDIRAISQDTLTTLVEYLQCEAGLFYSAGEERLHLTAGYAMDKGAVPEQLSFGETLVGEAAKRREVIQLHDVPEQFLKIRSGLGTASPRSLLIVPLCTDERVQGVIEVASLHPIEAYQMQFVKEIASDIAISLQAAKSKQRLQELFEETQAQSEELQSQHSELENINAELEAQAEKLQASEEELRVQQEELQQANQELEERSRLLEERNEMILERNLEIQSKAEELEISTKYKSEFLANMSHELRTPLNSILLLSRLLSENHESNLSSDQVEYANVIQNSGKGLLTLIDEILDLSKIEAGKMELDYSDVSLEGLTSEIHSLFAPLAKDKGISFAIETAENLPGILETDKLRLEQILRNLLSNALKFTKRGSVTLKIAKEDKALSFAVIDTGIGIPKDKQKTIFEAFQQADGSTRRQFGGTGLGLSISRELARLLGGEIQLKSEEGKGSEFTLVVPIHKGQTIA